MLQGGTRFAAVLAAAALAVGFLVACGGGDDSTTTTAVSTGNGSLGHDEDSATFEGNGSKKQGSGGEASDAGSGSADSSSSSAKVEPEPLRVSGGGSEQFREPGGDNSIQEFGEESDESELEEAAAALHGFYVARAEEKWAEACTYLSTSTVQQFETLASRSDQLKGKSCAGILEGFTPALPASVRRETTLVDAGSLRHEGEQAFLIYSGEGGSVFAIPMDQEDGQWKVAALAGTPLS